MKKIQILIVLALLAGLVFTPGAVSAQKFTSYVTGTQVMNLSSAEASIIMTYYSVDDGSATAGEQADEVSDTIAGNSSKTYFPAVSPFNGSVVISSNQLVGAVVNVQNAAATASAAYVGASSGATTVSLPLLLNNNGSVPYDTWFSVQNAGSLEATVDIDYSDPACANEASLQDIKIKPNASKQFSQSDAGTPCITQKVLSATITSDQPIVVVVLEENRDKILAYTGFPQETASSEIVMPLVNTNNSGITTGIQIQNTGDAATTVTVSYTPSLAGTACTETQTIQGNSSATFALAAFAVANPPNITTNCTPGQRFVGSARVTQTGTAPLVSIVNQTKGTYGEAYGAFNPDAATPKVVMPLLMDRNGNNSYSTGFSVMNVGDAAVYVQCTLTGDAAANYKPNAQLQPGQALTPNQAGQIAVRYVGSGQCTAYEDAAFTNVAETARLVAVVNELGNTSADRLLVYEGINVDVTE